MISLASDNKYKFNEKNNKYMFVQKRKKGTTPNPDCIAIARRHQLGATNELSCPSLQFAFGRQPVTLRQHK
jgi:hypothetical protein